LNREDILARLSKRAQLQSQIAALQSELEAEEKWFEAISLILPPAFMATIRAAEAGNSDASDSRSAWRRAVEAVVSAATRGLLPKEIAQGIRESGDAEARERISRNPNGIYAAIERMAEDGQIVRYRDKIYSVALHSVLSQNGELDDDADGDSLGSVNTYIINGLNMFGPMAPKTIMKMMKEDETLAARIAKNPQYGYSALSRLVRHGQIQKGSDGKYRLPSNENEPFDAPPSNGSDVGSRGDIFS
jgi:hypothetical protein